MFKLLLEVTHVLLIAQGPEVIRGERSMLARKAGDADDEVWHA